MDYGGEFYVNRLYGPYASEKEAHEVEWQLNETWTDVMLMEKI